MTISLRQWTMAFAAALTTHALAAVLLPRVLSNRKKTPLPPQPVLVSLATTPEQPSPLLWRRHRRPCAPHRRWPASPDLMCRHQKRRL